MNVRVARSSFVPFRLDQERSRRQKLVNAESGRNKAKIAS
jgi:hypothetical protein